MSKSNAYFQHWCESAETTAETWAETGAAQVLLARMDRLDDLMDAIAGHDLDGVIDAIAEEWSNAECELDNIRTAVLDEAWAEHPSEDDEVQWDMDEHAPSVSDAIKSHRRAMRDKLLTECLAPVTRITPTGVGV